jgi:hypothetical protein
VHMVSFENFVKLVSPSLSELKVTPSFCFAFKIPDDVTESTIYLLKFIYPNHMNHAVVGHLAGEKFPKFIASSINAFRCLRL